MAALNRRSATAFLSRMNPYTDPAATMPIAASRRLPGGCAPQPLGAMYRPSLGSTRARVATGQHKRAGEFFFPELGGFTDCPIYDRYRLRPGFVCEGPAIVEEHESTAVLGPSDGGRIDQFGNFIITVGQGESR